MILFLLEPSTIFHYGMWSYNSVTCDIPLISNPSSKNRIAEKKRKEKKNQIEFNFCVSNISKILLQTQVLSIRQVDEPYIGLTQENSIESSVQDSPPYILKSHGLC